MRQSLKSLALIALVLGITTGAFCTAHRGQALVSGCTSPPTAELTIFYEEVDSANWYAIYHVSGNAYGGTVEIEIDGDPGGPMGDVIPAADRFEDILNDSSIAWVDASTSFPVIVTVRTSCGSRVLRQQVTIPDGNSTSTNSCPRYFLIDSRGSGETQDELSPPGKVLAKQLKELEGANRIKATANHYEAVGIMPTLTEILKSFGRNPGEALAKIHLIQNALNGVGALARAKGIGAYHASVEDGKSKLTDTIRKEVGSCGSAGTKIILDGYSQGAQVTGDVYQSLSTSLREHVAAVVLFGDPRYNHKSFASASKRDNNGILPVRSEFPADGRGKVISYCRARDPICQGLGQYFLHGGGAHKNYQPMIGDIRKILRA